MIITVTGEIKKPEKGVILPHEHIFSDLRPLVDPLDIPEFNEPLQLSNYGMVTRNPYAVLDNALLPDIDVQTEELKRFKKNGGSMIVDVTTDDFGRDPKKLKEVSVQVPIDLRSTYNSQTLRNYSICLRVKVDPNLGEYSFDELLKTVALQLRLANDEKKLNAMVTANMGLERNPVLKFLPLAVKDLGVGISFLITGEQTTTALLSNLGPVKLPEEMTPHIESAFLMPGPGKRNAARCGLATYGDKTVFIFANIFEDNDIEREFFTRLVKMGLHVKIESNRE